MPLLCPPASSGEHTGSVDMSMWLQYALGRWPWMHKSIAVICIITCSETWIVAIVDRWLLCLCGAKASFTLYCCYLVFLLFVSASAAGTSIAPVIVAHPRSIQVHLGESASLSVEVSVADSDVTYKWYKDGLFLYGECQPQLLLQMARESDVGVYYCRVEGRFGATDSHPARVDVLPANTRFSASMPEYTGYQPNHGLTRDDLIHDLFREPYIPRKESGDTASLPSLDSMPVSHQRGYIEPAYTSRGLVSNSSANPVPSITEQLQNTKISDGQFIHCGICLCL